MWRVPEPGGARGWHGMLDILRRYWSSASCTTRHTRGEDEEGGGEGWGGDNNTVGTGEKGGKRRTAGRR